MGARFHYGNAGGRPAPYVVSQLGGAYYQVPDFLDTQHPIHNAAGRGLLSRPARGLRRQSRPGNRPHPPRRGARASPRPTSSSTRRSAISSGCGRRRRPRPRLVRSLARRAGEAHVEGDYAARATALVSGPIAAALDRQIAALRALRPHATHQAGAGRLPDGEAYYAWGLRANTTTTMTGEEIHRLGLAQVAEIQAQLDPLLRAEGFTPGHGRRADQRAQRRPALPLSQ